MPTIEPRVDAYIAKAAPFAQPILKHIRALVHKACPEVEEVMKWSFPNFVYGGGTICSMASFKQHCAFGFWKHTLLPEALQKKLAMKTDEAMGNMGRIATLKDLPSDAAIIAGVKEAMRLNDAGIKIPRKTPVKTVALDVPDYLKKALTKNKAAKTTFDAFSPGAQKEYIEWLEEAKTEATRTKRLETAVEWIAEGKKRHWKYQR